MPTNVTEKSLEDIIVNYLVQNNGYEQGVNADYNREYAIDEKRLFRFLQATQPKEMLKLGLPGNDLQRTKFFNRLQSEILKRGIVDVLRKGIKDGPIHLDLFYLTPSEKNIQAQEHFQQNIFSVIRQLQYSPTATRCALDLALFINGLPILTCELKNTISGQNVEDAVEQYKTDRNPREAIFQFKRCLVHFAIDDQQVKFCTKLNSQKSWFLPFNKGFNDGAGNPPNPSGIKTDYMWKDIFTKNQLTNIIENYAQVVDKGSKQIFPRYHQLAVVSALLKDVQEKGVGQRYLVQHSAGSGKSNSIAWLAHQLIGLEKDGQNIVDSVVVVTDRRNLDDQIKNTIKQFTEVRSTVVHADHSNDLRQAIDSGKKIIITTIQKFPYILESLGTEHKGRKFAIIIDEAHSSQSGRTAAKMNTALSGEYDPDDTQSTEDLINEAIEGRKMLTNASYFAFTATPKNKTLEMFGKAVIEPDGTVRHLPFHNYPMKQAIQEGFIMDVLQYYTPISSYYKLAKIVENDPLFDKKKAQAKLRSFVESNQFAISQKAAMMVEHFHTQVIGQNKIGGQARAMVVTGSILQAIDYFYAFQKCLAQRKSPYKAIVAFSGEKEHDGQICTEASLNGFPSSQIPDKFKEDPYRFLIVANKFQTGFDEPLLHTMYVDKQLSDIKAVQTLSRLNRAHPLKFDTFVLDFANDALTIEEAFSAYYRTTILSGETDPNKLNDLVCEMENHQVYTQSQVNLLVDLYLHKANRSQIDPILDNCATNYKDLEREDQVKFKSAAKSFVRTYSFLGAIMPYGSPEWEKLSIFLTLLLPKLPAPLEDDLSAGILQAVDLDSYRIQAQSMMSIRLEDANAEIGPVPVGQAMQPKEAELDPLTVILDEFNSLFGNIDWKDKDNIKQQISTLPQAVAQNQNYRNAAKNSDKENAKMESDKALDEAILARFSDWYELFDQFQSNASFKEWLSNMVFKATYGKLRGNRPYC